MVTRSGSRRSGIQTATTTCSRPTTCGERTVASFAGGVGVDQNRNYQLGWSGPCPGSTSVRSETYKGPSPASEAETQTMMTWSETRALRQGHRLPLIRPGSALRVSLPRPSVHELDAAGGGRALAGIRLRRIDAAPERGRRTSRNGSSPRMGAYAFLIETHTEFQPSYTSAVNEATLVWPGILSVLERPIPVSGHVTDARTGAPLAANIELSRRHRSRTARRTRAAVPSARTTSSCRRARMTCGSRRPATRPLSAASP